ncbi:MAG: serine hydrolase [Bacteroidota bacterium]
MRIRLQMVFAFVLLMGLIVIIQIPDAPEKEERWQPVSFLRADAARVDSALGKMSLVEKLSRLLVVRVEPEDLDNEIFREVSENYSLGGYLLQDFSVDSARRTIQYLRSQHPTSPLIGFQPIPTPSSIWPLPQGIALGHVEQENVLHSIVENGVTAFSSLGAHFWVQEVPTGWLTRSNYRLFSENYAQLTEEIQAYSHLFALHAQDIYHPHKQDSLYRENCLLPLRRSVKMGLSTLILPATDLRTNRPVLHRAEYLHPYLKRQLKFEGLVILDFPDSLTQTDDWLEDFILSGADVWMTSTNQVPSVIRGLQQMCQQGKWDLADLDERVKRTMMAQAWSEVGNEETKDSTTYWVQNLDSREVEEKILSESIVLAKDEQKLIPLRDLGRAATHLMTVGEEMPDLLFQMRQYGPVSHTHIKLNRKGELPKLNLRSYRRYDPILVAFNLPELDTSLHRTFFASLEKLAKVEKVLIINLGSWDHLAYWKQYKGLMQVYYTGKRSQQLLAQGLFGGIPLTGTLPATLDETLAHRDGEIREKVRLGYSYPEKVGMDSEALRKIDDIVAEGIRHFAMPGCQVLVVKDDEIIWNKAYGHHTYDRRRRVRQTDLYDIASLTKITATSLAMMKMVDRGEMSIQDPVGKFFQNTYVQIDSIVRRDTLWVTRAEITPRSAAPDSAADVPIVMVSSRDGRRPPMDTVAIGEDSLMLIQTYRGGRTKRRASWHNVRLRDLLTHHSGLSAALPILPYLRYRKDNIGRFDKYFKPRPDDLHNVQVAQNFYLRKDYLDSLWQGVLAMPVAADPVYNYSDANMILLQMAIDSLNQISMDSFLRREFYEPLGLQHLRFRPRKTLYKDRLIPTAYDSRWRMQLLRGHVHDEHAALLGGVAGNAGVFTNAGDLAHLMTMIQHQGMYGGARYLKSNVVRLFTRPHIGTRGLGFEVVRGRGEARAGSLANPGTYGHTGFTGTCIWVDPETNLTYIFLSNRVQGTPRGGRGSAFYKYRIRERIHDAIYQAMDPQTP